MCLPFLSLEHTFKRKTPCGPLGPVGPLTPVSPGTPFGPTFPVAPEVGTIAIYLELVNYATTFFSSLSSWTRTSTIATITRSAGSTRSASSSSSSRNTCYGYCIQYTFIAFINVIYYKYVYNMSLYLNSNCFCSLCFPKRNKEIFDFKSSR